ncbi:MAG: hypothetical protein LUD47_06905, partial [Clostridia bacterium]|nr:hypothetical protein [Clostridia bacterium]
SVQKDEVEDRGRKLTRENKEFTQNASAQKTAGVLFIAKSANPHLQISAERAVPDTKISAERVSSRLKISAERAKYAFQISAEGV